MKTTKILVLALLSLYGVSNAAVSVGMKSFTGSSATAGTGYTILKTTTTALTTGSIAVGGFNTTLPNWTTDSAATILGLFTQNGSSKTVNTIVNTTVSDAATSTDGTGIWLSPTAKTMYVMLGNASTIAASTDYLIFQAGQWPQEIAGVGAVVNVDLTTAPLLRGSKVASPLAAPWNNYTQGITFGTAVPEPSAALLGALGVLGLLRRRRN